MNEYYGLIIALILFSLAWSFVPRKKSYLDELDDNARRIERERIEKMQKGVSDGK